MPILFFVACIRNSPNISTVQLDPMILAELPEQYILVEKEQRRLSIYSGIEVVLIDGKEASWSIGLGDQPLGHKQTEGDERTPEGIYRYSDHAPHSSYTGSLLIHYPNREDAQKAFKEGRITAKERNEIQSMNLKGVPPPMNSHLGGWLLVHGTQKSTGLPLRSGEFDWTNGCIAMNDADLEFLRKQVGTEGMIWILP